MANDQERRIRKSSVAGGAALLGALFSADAASAQQMPQSGIGDYLEATRPPFDDHNYFAEERRAENFDLGDEVGAGLGRYVQRDLFQQRFGVRIPGRMEFTTEDVYGDDIRGDGARVVLRFNEGRPLSDLWNRRRSVFDPDRE